MDVPAELKAGVQRRDDDEASARTPRHDPVRRERGPRTQPGAPAPELVKAANYDKLSVYYNLDNGTGQIRGINMQGNEQLRSVFRPWLQSFRDWNSTTITRDLSTA